MSDNGRLAGRKILVVEDEYLIASDLAEYLREQDTEVIGPVGSIEKAIELLDDVPELHGALLDLNLHGRLAFPVAEALLLRDVPFVFTTGYDRAVIPARYAHVTCCEKPVELKALAHALFGQMEKGSAA